MSRLLAGAEPGALGPGLGDENTGGPVLRRLKHRGAFSWGHDGTFTENRQTCKRNYYKAQVICYRKRNTDMNIIEKLMEECKDNMDSP